MSSDEILEALSFLLPDDPETQYLLSDIGEKLIELEMWQMWAKEITKTQSIDDGIHRALIREMIERR